MVVSAPRPGRWYLWVRAGLLGSGAGLLLPLLNPWLAHSGGTLPWLLDLAVHWQWLYLLGLIAGVAAVLRVNRRWAMLLLLAALPFVTASPGAPQLADGPALSVATVNLHLDTTDVEKLAPWLAAEQPDLVVLLEVSPRLAKALKTLKDYPFQLVHPEDSPFGIALLSRLPLATSAIVIGDDGIAHLEADVRFAGGVIAMRAFHPMPPLSPTFHQARNRQLAALIDPARAGALPQLVAGDFNASPWSQAMVGVPASGWRRATSLRPTWPAWGQGLLGIPIDQVLVSPGWGVESREVGPDLGSDHLPVMVRLRLARVLAGAG